MGAALLLVLLVGAALAPAAAAPVAAAAPDLIESSVLAYSENKVPPELARLSTPLAERVLEGDPVQMLGTLGPPARTYVYVKLAPEIPTTILDSILSGIVDRDEGYGLVTARVTDAELASLATLEGVRQVREVDPPVTSVGSVMTEGDAVIRADILRAQGLTGAGVRIGVISDGADGVAAAQTSGDLGMIQVLSDDVGGGEGAAMLEIVHDIAPGAELYFHDHGGTVLGFNRAIDDLVAAGCTVIVDDVTWPGEPYFEDGVIAPHIGSILATKQIVYVTSAGNYARQHFQGSFVDKGRGFQDFSGTGSDQPYLYAFIPYGGKLRVVMQWDEPFGSSGDDFDLYLCDTRTSDVLWASIDRQTGSSDPLEAIAWRNTGADRLVAIVALHRGSTGSARTLELYAYPSSGAGVYKVNTVASDSIWGHQALLDVVTVGAVNASSPDSIEPFSSNGPITHLYPSSTVIQKPDICAPDQVAVTGSGRFATDFFGTSAAAPHIGALCALIWSARPELSPAQIHAALYSSAVDLGIPGRDNVYGWGRADGAAMYAMLSASATPAPIATRSPFEKLYPIGYPTDRSIGGLIVAKDADSTQPGSPVAKQTTDPLKPPTKPYVRWYPEDRWGSTGR